MVNRICGYCGELIKKTDRLRKYHKECSKKARLMQQNERRRKRRKPKICLYCSKIIEKITSNSQKYHKDCFGLHRKEYGKKKWKRYYLEKKQDLNWVRKERERLKKYYKKPRYKRNCNYCGGYYEGGGKFYCCRKCAYSSNTLKENHRISTLNQFKNGMSKKTKKKLSKIIKRMYKEGKIKVWSEGLTKETDKRIKRYSIKNSKTMKKIWNSPEKKRFAKERRAKQILPRIDTKIEVKIQNFLKQLGIEFFTHQYMKIEHGYQCDVLIPSMNLVIECDGDYWHKYPIGTWIDHIRTSELLEKGFKVLRLWEREIKVMELDGFWEKLNVF